MLHEGLRKEKKRRLTALLLSVLVPGLGQLYRKRLGAGFFFLSLTLLSLTFLRRIWKGWSPTFISIFLAYLTLWLINVLDSYKGPVYPKPPCRNACPADIDVSGYIELIRRGRFGDALELISLKAPLPGVLGYVCPAPCEGKCARAGMDGAVRIRHLKMAAALNADFQFPPPARKRNRRIAVVGGGPAGLTAAHFLALEGYKVMLFDKNSELGGMLRYGIPPYRLPREVLDRDIGRIVDKRIEVRTSVNIGRDVSLEELMREFDAIIVAAGDQLSKPLRVKGENLEGVIYALDFLRRTIEVEKVEVGGNVIVIGGGNVAIDCGKTALRLGAKKVRIVALETRDLSSPDRLPACDREIEEAEEEGIEILDRLGPAEILGADGRVKALKTVRCLRVYDEKGRFSPLFDYKAESPVLPADMIIVAIGQEPDYSFLPQGIRVLKGFKTPIKGVFVIPGSGSVAEAIAKGRQTALEVQKYLEGNFRYFLKKLFSFEPVIGKGRLKKPILQSPVPISKENPDLRKKDFRTIEKPLSCDAAQSEAMRCLGCPFRFRV